MSTTTWNQEQEVLIAASELGDSTGRDAVALLVAARKRAFDAEQRLRQLAPAKPWDDAREFQRLAGEVAAIDRKDPVAFMRELHHMILSARKVAFWADERAYALKLELEALKADAKWISPSERLPADDARLLALVVDDTGTEQVEIVNFIACIPAWSFDSDNAAIDDELVTGWMPLPGRMR